MSRSPWPPDRETQEENRLIIILVENLFTYFNYFISRLSRNRPENTHGE